MGQTTAETAAVRPLRAGRGVVVITGASSGIGRATAACFAHRGWDVGLIARGETGLTASHTDVETIGRRAVTAPADVSDSRALEHAAERIEATLGPIDVWINGAGVTFYAPFLDIKDDEFRRVTDVTYMGTVNGTRVALRRMVPRKRGTVINIGSAVAYRGVPLQTPYSAAKYAVRGFTEAVRSEMLHDRTGVRVTMVHPPAVNTPFFSHAGGRMDAAPRPPPPVYQPELIARAIHFAATHRRREVQVGSSSAQMELMNKIAPRFSDWLVGTFGVRAQQTKRADIQAARDPSLFRAASGAPPVHGPWRARGFSVRFWATEHRAAVLAAAAVGVLAGLAGQRLATPAQRIAPTKAGRRKSRDRQRWSAFGSR